MVKTMPASQLHDPDVEKSQNHHPHSTNGDKADSDSAMIDVFRWSRCKKPLPQKVMRTIGIPLPLEHVEVFSSLCFISFPMETGCEPVAIESNAPVTSLHFFFLGKKKNLVSVQHACIFALISVFPLHPRPYIAAHSWLANSCRIIQFVKVTICFHYTVIENLLFLFRCWRRTWTGKIYNGRKPVFGLQGRNILLHGCISCQRIN